MIMRLTLVAVAFLVGLTLAPERAVRLDPGLSVAEAGFGGRGGGGGRMRAGGGGHRGGHGIRGRASRPHGGAKVRPRPNRPRALPARNRPAAGNRPNRPNVGNRPNRPNAGNRPNRPNAGNRPNRPNAGNRPNRPNAGNRPNRPNIGSGNVNIGSGNVNINRPVLRPGVRPPHYRPPYWRPPGWRPPYYRPPYVRPPHWRWGDYHYYPAWGWYFTAAIAGATLVYVANLPDDDGECQKVEYEGETLYECDGVLYRSTLYEDEQVYEIVSSEEEAEEAATGAAPAGGGGGGGSAAPAPGDALFLTSPMMRGNQVKAVQIALSSFGYDVGTPDGVFGSGTDRAVRAFQIDQGLPETGIVAGDTLEALGL